MMEKVLKKVENSDENIKEMCGDILGMSQKVDSHDITIKQLELQLGQVSIALNQR